ADRAVSALDSTAFIAHVLLRLLFFVSRRRRHTRWPRDWSSDVCSSDLVVKPRVLGVELPRFDDIVRAKRPQHLPVVLARDKVRRSEERRVGKECGSRWWTYDCKQNVKSGGVVDPEHLEHAEGVTLEG